MQNYKEKIIMIEWNCKIGGQVKSKHYTVEPVCNGHLWDHQNIVVIDRWSLYRNILNNNHLVRWSLCKGFLKTSACQI